MDQLLSFRPVNLNDAVAILSWRNDPSVYIWLRVNGPIDPEQHFIWLSARIAVLERQPFLCFELSGSPVGFVRFDDCGQNVFEVSLIISPSSRRKGYGQQVLRQSLDWVRSKFPQTSFVAEIHENNLASQKLFSKLGFSLFSVSAENHFFRFNLA